VTFVVITLLINTVQSFVIPISSPSQSLRRSSIIITTPTQLSVIKPNDVITLSLNKPLGLVLEESDDGVGVVVASITESGSAYLYPQKEALVGSWVVNVMGKDVSNSNFDTVMETIITAEPTVEIAFALSRVIDDDDDEVYSSGDDSTTTYEVGTLVAIQVQQPATGKPDIILNAKVGDNLRKTLLSNPNIELYRGLKKKLGNCGGGGQCGFCAVEFIDDSGDAKVWGTRSEYEAKKIGKNGSETQRLACMNNIVGPATIVTL
jgi:ferredoxin